MAIMKINLKSVIMNDQDKEDVIYAVSTVALAVESVEGRLDDLRNDVVGLDNGIAGPGGVISHLHLINRNLVTIKWLLASLLVTVVIVLFN